MSAVLAYQTPRVDPRRAQAPCDADAIGAGAVDCLLQELETWPKPGLVSHVDNGSPGQMGPRPFRRSAAAIGPYFQQLADTAARGCGMGRLRMIGLEAEAAM